jgi:hypothetical protein
LDHFSRHHLFPPYLLEWQNDDSDPGNDELEVDYSVNDLGVAHSGETITTSGWVAAIVPSGKTETVCSPG